MKRKLGERGSGVRLGLIVKSVQKIRSGEDGNGSELCEGCVHRCRGEKKKSHEHSTERLTERARRIEEGRRRRQGRGGKRRGDRSDEEGTNGKPTWKQFLSEEGRGEITGGFSSGGETRKG